MKKRLFVILLALVMVAGLSAIMLAADGESDAVAKIGGTEYATLEDAVAAVPTDGTETTITLLKSVTGGGVKVLAGQNIIFDFNGHTYTVGDPTVGSTGTETNGFQLLRDSTVTMKNGTLKASDYEKLKIMIQNYSDLTLLDMELDAREAPQCLYVASNNFGDVLITGDTSIYAADGQVAFDVYYWPNNGYGDGVSVTVDTTGTIEGTIEYGSDGSTTGKTDIAEKAPLVIKSGTIDGTISTYDLDTEGNTGINITGGSFTSDVSKYVAEGNKLVDDGNGNYSISVDEETAIAEANGVGYTSLQAAIDAISGTGEVKLLSNTTEDVIVSSGNITLNLNGCTLTNVSSDTISVKIGATLTVTGNGTVDNKSNGRAAIFNEGTVILNGGTYDRTSETGSSADVSGGNSWYTICNHGTMTINEGVTVKNTGSFSSMIENGYYSYGSGNPRSGYIAGTNAANPSLIINNGSFIGGLNTVKNDDGGVLEINGGTYTNTTQAAILNWNKATITDGTFECSAANCVLNGAFAADPSANNQGILTITGGSFTSTGTPIANHFSNEDVEVSGGTFSGALPDSYYAPGFKPVFENGHYVVKETVTVTFTGSGTNYTKSDVVTVGEKITAPAGTIKPGYTVEGWYTDAELTDKWDFENDVVSGEETSLVLYAKFVAVDTVLDYPCSAEDPITISSGITTPDGYTYEFIWKNAKGEVIGTKADVAVATPGAGNSAAYVLTVTSTNQANNETYTYTIVYQVSQDAHTGGKATCTHQAKCSLCNERYGELNPDNHAYATEIRNAVAATTETEGYTGDTYCKGCGVMVKKGSIIPKLDHEHSMVKTDAKAATCTEAGNIEYYTCSVCGKLYKDANGTVEITLADTVIEATGHQYGSEYKHSDTEHWKECTVCGEKTDVAEHTFGEWVITKEATATSDGSKERTCSVCGATVTEVIPATGEETTAPTETTTPAEKSDTNVGMIVLWVVIALVVIAAVVFIILYMKKKKGSDSSTGNNTNNKPTSKN